MGGIAADIRAAVEAALQGKAIDPQVLVTLAASPVSSVTVIVQLKLTVSPAKAASPISCTMQAGV